MNHQKTHKGKWLEHLYIYLSSETKGRRIKVIIN
jgi:hypothetical protein